MATGRVYARIGLGLAAAGLCASGAHAQDDAARADFFNKRVAPILAGSCLDCHGGDKKGGLDLRSREGLAAGGKQGPALVPGDPAASHLMELVTAQEMPPKKPLAAEEIDVLRQWIAEGAWFPETPLNPFAITSGKRAGFDWWSLQALRDDAPPEVDAPEVWKQHPLDRFVVAELQEAGLTPSAPADPATLVRRATYDLTGLPPTPEEVDAFVAACRAETGAEGQVGEAAYRDLLDALLASPRYGEQWGRHWLDAVRYGESNGYERNVLFDNIWPYRDYVIKSLNEDKPFSRMTMEQLAGDAVDPGNPEVEVGMTYLVCGPYDDVGNQDPVKAAQTRADNIDEMIRTTSEAFLGLTVGCARCHDHKFDPISQKDYYRFYATFAGVYPDSREVASEERRKAREETLRPLEKRKREATQARGEWEHALLERGKARLDELSAAWVRPPANRYLTEDTFTPVQAQQVRLTVLGRDNDPDGTTTFRIDEFEAWTPDGRNVALAANGGNAVGQSNQPGDFAEAYEANLTIDGAYGARWIAGSPVLTIRFAQPETIDRVNFSSDRPKGQALESGDTTFICEYRVEVSMDGNTWTEVSSSRDRQPVSDVHRNKRLKEAVATPEDWAERDRLNAEVDAANAALAAVPPLPVLRVGRLSQPDPVVNVFLGGDPQRKGDEVTSASPEALPTADAYALAADAPEQERRVALARWLVHKDNPLPPRVLANRLWQFHFGTGLVQTSGDFGFMGTPPSHPALLDWLAREIIRPTWNPDGAGYDVPDTIREAWRLKRMHKLMMLSQTYRQSSANNEAASAVDADTRLLWRFPPRRLSAEEIRDSILSITGVLNTTMGGPGFRLYQYLNDNVSTYLPLDKFGPETYRRSVYHQQARAMRVDLLTDFDAPDCAMTAPRRVATTTPLQALTMMNHTFTMDMAAALSERLKREAGDDAAAQVRLAYRLAFGRIPGEEELAEASRLAAAHGLRAFCRALLNASELIYLE